MEGTITNASSGDLKAQISNELRRNALRKLVEFVKKSKPGDTDINTLSRIAEKIEKNCLTDAINEFDYKQKVMEKLQCLNKLIQQTASQNSSINSAVRNQNLADPALVDSSAHPGHVGLVDWREEIYQKIKSLKEQHRPTLLLCYQKVARELQQFDPHKATPGMSGRYNMLKTRKSQLEKVLAFLVWPKEKINPGLKERLPEIEGRIVKFLASCGVTKTIHSQQQTQLQLQGSSQVSTNRLQHSYDWSSIRGNSIGSGAEGSLPNITTSAHSRCSVNTIRSHGTDHLMHQQLREKQQQLQSRHSKYLQVSDSFPSRNCEASPPQTQQPSFEPTLQTSVGPVNTPSQKSGDSERHPCVVSSPPTTLAAHQMTASCLPVDVQTVPKECPGERPVEHLVRMVQSLSQEALKSSVNDIWSIVNTNDMLAGPATSNHIREDLSAMTGCCLDEGRKMKRQIDAVPMSLNIVSSDGRVKRHKAEVCHNSILEEIREINRQVISTNVRISDESVRPSWDGTEQGTVIQCLFDSIILCPSLKSRMPTSLLPLTISVPANYPESPPIIVDDCEPRSVCREFEDMYRKARLMLGMTLSQPASIREMVMAWDACTRRVVIEYAHQFGGGTISSRYRRSTHSCVGA